MSRAMTHVRSFATTGLDQVFSSLSNVIIAIAVGRGGGTGALGTFSLAFAGYVLVLGFARSLITEPLLAMPMRGRRTDTAPALALSITVAAAGTAVGIAAAVWTGRTELLVLALSLPALILQDAQRYAAFRERRAGDALLLDATWCAVSLAVYPMILRTGSPALAVVLWAIGSVAASAMGVRLGYVPGAWRAARPWWANEARRLGLGLAAESITYTVGSQVTFILVAALAGTNALGEIRAGQIVVGPAAMLMSAVNLYALPRVALRGGVGGREAVRLAAASALLGLCCVAGVLVGGRAVSTSVFGAGTAVPTMLLLAATAQVIFNGIASGFVVGFKASGNGRALAVARLCAVVIAVPMAMVAALLGSIVAIAWTFAVPAATYLAAVIVLSRRTTVRSASAGSLNIETYDHPFEDRFATARRITLEAT